MSDYDISGAFEAIENELMNSMMRNFKRHRAEETAEGYNWSMWQAKQLESLEEYRKNNRKIFSKRFDTINGKISEMLKKAREDGNAAQEIEILQRIAEGYKIPGKPSKTSTGEFFKINDRKLNALIKATRRDFRKAEYAILRRSNDVYRTAIFNAQVYANTGAGTYEKAVDMACRDFQYAGLQCVEYKNGSRHTLEEYSRMAIRTSNKRAYLMGEGEKRAEWGIHTVVVNSRMGGCPLCAPYIGKVFIDDVYSGGKKSGGSYPLLSTAIQGGLFHPNCKDSTSTYYEGITTLEPVTEDELNDMKRVDALEQQKKAYENRAKKCARVAKYALDPDNRRTYAARAKANESKAAEIAEKLPETVDYSGDRGIINLNREMRRRDRNIGAFSNLEIPMQKRSVLAICRKYNIDTKGITFKIQRSEHFLNIFIYGDTDYNNIGRIDLFPNAFINEDELLKTILHEKCHVLQLKKYGRQYVQDHLGEMESVAYRFQDLFFTIIKRRAKR